MTAYSDPCDRGFTVSKVEAQRVAPITKMSGDQRLTASKVEAQFNLNQEESKQLQ